MKKTSTATFRWRPAIQYKSFFSAKGENDPFNLFEKLFLEARKALNMPEATVLSTVDGFERPASRIVLLKGLYQGLFCFFTNYDSHKSQQMEKNSQASLLFFWEPLEIQIRIQGRAEKVPPRYSDHYWKTRPRESQIGALASDQSSAIESYSALLRKAKALEKKWKGKPIPRPSNWGAWGISPSSFEFWFGRPNRLHERVYFELNDQQKWKRTILSP